jgi:uncharacterized protein YbjT (DUF2867 family)
MARNVEQAARRFGHGFEFVEGDLADEWCLRVAAKNCFGIHINLSGEIEQVGAERVSAVASKLKLERITYISGTSVAEENIWEPTIKRKFFAEQAIRESGVPYTIFCPTWFMEVLPKYVRGSRAFVFGKQPNPYHLIAAEDYARMVVAAYENKEAANKRLILHGPEGILFHDAVKRYCQAIHPEIQKVATMPYWLASLIAAIKDPKELKQASGFMAAFEKIGEWGDPSEANVLLGAPRVRLDDWLRKKQKHKLQDHVATPAMSTLAKRRA